MVGRAIGTFVGVVLGAILGTGTGIAGAFGGVPGILVFPVVGGVIGLTATPDISKMLKKLRVERKRIEK